MALKEQVRKVELKTYRTGHVDLATGKIYGCKKGSWKWYHEQGHIKFNSNEKYSFLILMQGYLQNIWIFLIMCSLVYRGILPYTILCCGLYFSIFLFEEGWCNQYANSKVKK